MKVSLRLFTQSFSIYFQISYFARFNVLDGKRFVFKSHDLRDQSIFRDGRNMASHDGFQISRD